MNETFRIEPLNDEHDRTGFLSGSAALDRYFQTQASQDVRRRIATCFVAVSNDSGQIAGYYTLSATSIAVDALSPQFIQKLPRYPVVPAALLGRLAVARTQQGLGLGGVLLADALKRSAGAEMGVFAMVVDAENEAAQRFYEHHGFTLLPRREAAPVPPDRYRTPTSRLTLKYFPSTCCGKRRRFDELAVHNGPACGLEQATEKTLSGPAHPPSSVAWPQVPRRDFA